MKRNYKSLSLISENLGILYGDGLPIVLAIELLEELPLEKRYKESIKNINARVVKGDSVSKAFKLYPELYPDFFTGLIALGEKSGELSKVLKSLSNYYSKMRKIQSEIISAMIYPIFLFLIMAAITIILIFVILPNLYNAFKSINTDLPLIIEKIYSFRMSFINNPVTTSIYLICYGIIIPGIILKVFIRRSKISKLSLKLKVVKEFNEYLLILNLSIILNSGIALSSALEHCSNNSDRLVIKNELLRVNKELIIGSELSRALDNNIILSKQSIAMIKIGESGGSLASIVSKLEARMEENVNASINKLLTKIQPACILIMAAGVGGFIFTFILPIFTMMYQGGK